MGVTLLLLWPLLTLAAGAEGDYRPYVPPTGSGVSVPLFVLIAYSAIWLVLLAYLVSVWWRQRQVEQEMRALQRRLENSP